nr:hypothetical protein [Acidimicrobiia bacterium]
APAAAEAGGDDGPAVAEGAPTGATPVEPTAPTELTEPAGEAPTAADALEAAPDVDEVSDGDPV